jgi:hypothetical protein
LLRLGGASPPHSLSSGARSCGPSPSQLGSASSAPAAASVSPAPLSCAGALSLRHGGRLVEACALVITGWLVGLGEAELLARGFFGGQLEKRVLVEHLLDFLAELQRGELQQPDRLLQLRRERQMLRNAKR